MADYTPIEHDNRFGLFPCGPHSLLLFYRRSGGSGVDCPQGHKRIRSGGTIALEYPGNAVIR